MDIAQRLAGRHSDEVNAALSSLSDPLERALAARELLASGPSRDGQLARIYHDAVRDLRVTHTPGEIAKLLGVSRARVSVILNGRKGSAS